jgi:hypothetical protein
VGRVMNTKSDVHNGRLSGALDSLNCGHDPKCKALPPAFYSRPGHRTLPQRACVCSFACFCDPVERSPLILNVMCAMRSRKIEFKFKNFTWLVATANSFEGVCSDTMRHAFARKQHPDMFSHR